MADTPIAGFSFVYLNVSFGCASSSSVTSFGVDKVFETFVWLYLREPVTKIPSVTSAVSDANKEYVLELPLTFAESSVSESSSQITLRMSFTSQSSVSVAWYDTVL